jgi:hypothetical protein
MTRPFGLTALLCALLLPGVASAEKAWALEDVEALRWPDAQQVSLVLEPGDEVTVVYRDEAMVRVRKGSEFGWVSAALLGDSNPEPDAEDPWAIPDLPALDIPGLPPAQPTEEAEPEAPAEPAAEPAPEAPAE